VALISPPPASSASSGTLPSLVESTRGLLANEGRERSPHGIVALILAEQLMVGGGTQSGLASLSKAFREALTAARVSRPAAPVVDEAGDTLAALRAKRATRAQRAAAVPPAPP
jgi:hypothetical protein